MDGRVVLVTGGGRGVGRGISEAFLSRGDRVLVCGRKEPEQLPEVDGNAARFLACDVRDPEAVGAMFTRVWEEHGRLDVLVNNAGGAPHVDAEDASPRFTAAIIDLNLTSAITCATQAHAIMREQEHGGAIVNIASVSALRPSPGTTAYGAAKAGLVSATRSLAVEWAPRVRVNAICAGLIETEQAELHYGDAEGVRAVAATVPMGRLGTPRDVGEACAWLASDAAAYVTGANLELHGGGEWPAFLRVGGDDDGTGG